MPVPKRKTSKMRRDARRSHHRVRPPELTECPNCHKQKPPHIVCPECGFYKGRQIIQPNEE